MSRRTTSKRFLKKTRCACGAKLSPPYRAVEAVTRYLACEQGALFPPADLKPEPVRDAH